MTTWAILLVIAAAALFMLEFAVPSFGMLGLLSATCYTFALILGFRESRELGIKVVVLGVLLAPVALAVGVKLVKNSPLGRLTTLAPPSGSEIGRMGTEALRRFEGRTGSALTDLRPGGRAAFDDERLDVTAAGGFIPKGASVRVIRVEGVRILVEAADAVAKKESAS
jgi:membrane-bound serine protease (ClpP class)